MKNDINVQNLIEILTPARLSSYKDTENSVFLDEYIYNIKVSEAFYPALSLLEITLRNKICNAIEKLIKRIGWFLNIMYSKF